jgi:hypothetical protein
MGHEGQKPGPLTQGKQYPIKHVYPKGWGRATEPSTGNLIPMEACKIYIMGQDIYLRVLPEITDTKSAAWNDEPIMGRAFPMKTYSHSENRTITMVCHFVVIEDRDIEDNLMALRLIESAVYPMDDPRFPYRPPPVCRIECGQLLGGGGGGQDRMPVCVILKSYSVQFPTDVPWDNGVRSGGQVGSATFLPYKFDVTCNWEVVYPTEDLPGQSRIAYGDGTKWGL